MDLILQNLPAEVKLERTVNFLCALEEEGRLILSHTKCFSCGNEGPCAAWGETFFCGGCSALVWLDCRETIN